MPVVRPRPPGPDDNEQTLPSRPSFESPSSAQLSNASTFEPSAPTMLVIATILLALFFIFRRTRRPSVTTRPRHDTMFDDQPLKSAVTAETITPESYIQWDEYPSPQLPFQPPYYQLGFPPLISQSETQPVASISVSTSSSSSHTKPSAALPIPTVRRHSLPTETAEPEMTETTRDSTAEAEAITTQEHIVPSSPVMNLPRPWVPGRTDTVATMNGCRRHVMVLDGEPFRRGSAG